MAQVDLRHSTIVLKDGSTPQKSVTVKIGEGNLTYTQSRPIEYMRDRGILDEVKLGKPVPLDVKLDATWVAIGTDVVIHSAAVPSVPSTVAYTTDLFMDMLRGTGAGMVSSDPDTTRPFACDIEISYLTTPYLSDDDADPLTPDVLVQSTTTILLQDFRYETADFDLNGGTISASGKCFNTKPTITES